MLDHWLISLFIPVSKNRQKNKSEYQFDKTWSESFYLHLHERICPIIESQVDDAQLDCRNDI